MPTVSDFVTLPTGVVVSAAAAFLALDLEARGLRLTVDGDGLLVSPGGRLTDEDRAAIRRWKLHLQAIVACAEAVAVVQ